METHTSSQFAQVLRRMRLSSGLSQEDLAERSGLSVRAISDLERGERTAPRMESVRMLADGLGLDPQARAELIAASRPELSTGSPGGSGQPPAPPTSRLRPIPIPPTAIIGRESEIEEISEVIRSPDVRLVTLTGEGGVGKTRLAFALASALADDFDDGVAFADLSAATSPSLVPAEIAAALGTMVSGDRQNEDVLSMALRDRSLLLVIDNFEHVLPAALIVSKLIATCAGLKVLITSRERLQLRGEQVVHIHPLQTASEGSDQPASTFPELMEIPATRLFLERSREVNFGFDLIKEDPRTIAAICQKLEGMPLAIELAAARTRTLPLAALLERLDRPLPVLTSGPRDLPERQRTLRNTIAWSYNLLPAEEQTLFQRMAVFSGGATLDAIHDVTAAGGPIELSPSTGIESLLDKSLVREARNPDGPLRITMLESIREFSTECLEASGISEATRQAHALWFFDLAMAARQDLRFGVDQARWFSTIERELGNIRAALQWFRVVNDGSHLVNMATALDEYWFSHSLYQESLDWIESGLQLDPDLSDTDLGWALCTAASCARVLKDLPAAEDFVSRALEAAERAQDPFLHGRALLSRAAIHQVHEEWSEAATLCETAKAMFEEAGALNYLALMYVEIGHMRQLLGDLDAAASQVDQGLALMHETGDRWAAAMTLEIRGHLAVSQHDFATAAKTLSDAIEIAGAIGDERTTLGAFTGLARLFLASDQPKLAARFLGTADVRSESGVGTPWLTRPHIAPTIESAKTALGEREFRAQWERGRNTPFSRALADAIRAAEDIGDNTAE